MEQALFNTVSELEMRQEREEMRGTPDPERIHILDPDAAKMLFILAVSNNAQTIVEVGTGLGYSTLWLAHAASKVGGKVITCETDPVKAEEAQQIFAKAEMSDYIEIVVGDARETLRHREESVDLLFIDADYGQYETYFDVVYKSMGVGGMIVADDVVESENDLADYTTYVQNHPSLESVTVPLGKGLEVTIKTAD